MAFSDTLAFDGSSCTGPRGRRCTSSHKGTRGNDLELLDEELAQN
jgi:hypothetical protein